MRLKLNGLMAAAVGLCLSGVAEAALQGRDLDGNLATAEAYYDTALNITWLADANYAGVKMEAGMANGWAANLSIADSVNNITYSDWRLPTAKPLNGIGYVVDYGNVSYVEGGQDAGYNISAPGSTYAGSIASEMAFMFYNTLGNSADFSLAGDYTGCNFSDSDTCLNNVGPFSNLQHDAYWTGSIFTGYGYGSDRWWLFDMREGSQNQIERYDNRFAWAVSDGDIGLATSVPEASTWAMMLAGLGLIGIAARRRT